jgi:hypothetical protein
MISDYHTDYDRSSAVSEERQEREDLFMDLIMLGPWAKEPFPSHTASLAVLLSDLLQPEEAFDSGSIIGSAMPALVAHRATFADGLL